MPSPNMYLNAMCCGHTNNIVPSYVNNSRLMFWGQSPEKNLFLKISVILECIGTGDHFLNITPVAQTLSETN